MIHPQKPSLWRKLGMIAALSTSIAFGTTAIPSLAVEQKANLSDSGSARVSLGGKIRLATQEIVALSCEVVHGSSPAAQAKLQAATANFTRMLGGLRDGDLALGIREPENNGRILSIIKRVEDNWQPIDNAIIAIRNGGDKNDALDRILATDKILLDQTESLLAALSGIYSNRDSFPFGATMAVNIAVRQDMLLQQIAKHECLLRSDDPKFTSSKEELAERIALFNTSMAALQTGAPDSGLMAPPTDQVKSALQTAETQWKTVQPLLSAQLNDVGTTGEVPFYEQAETQQLRKALNNSEVLYLLATSGQPDIYRVPLERYAREQLSRWLLEPQMVIALRAQNIEHSSITQAKIDEMDQLWRAEVDSGQHDTIAEMMSRPLSGILKTYQDATAGIVTEVFVMDNKGLNVGQSEVTSDLWQGDEDKWQETFLNEANEMHISEVEFDDSTGFYQAQVSLPITEPVSGARIGAVTFGVNIQSLL